MTRKLLLIGAAGLLLPACQVSQKPANEAAGMNAAAETNAAAPVDTAADDAAIRASISRWLDLIKTKDAAKIAQFYADDGVVMPAGQPIVAGREAIQKFWQSTVDVPEMTMTFGPERIDFSKSGDLAIDRGTYRFTGKPQGGQPIDEKGKYVVVWKKAGSDWRVLADIFNSDKPAGG